MPRRLVYSDYHRLTPSELEKLGFSRKARRYLPQTIRKPFARTKTISARQHETLRTRQEYGLSTPEVATKAREAGALRYKTARQQEAVAKAADTRLLRKVERSEGEAIPNANPARNRRGQRSVLTSSAIERFERNRERRLRNEYIPDGEWHEMMDIAHRFKDARVAQLRQSPLAAYTIGK
jgi:hypothetical protein